MVLSNFFIENNVSHIEDMTPTFTVIIATYNRASFLNRALDALIAQTETDWEAIIIDDGSTDETESILQPYLANYANFQYIKIENSGEAYAKNLGISLGRGKYITFLDSDDAYETTHLAYRKSILINNPDIQLLHGGVKVIGDPYVPDLHHPGQFIHLSQCVVGASFFIRRDVLCVLEGLKDMPLGNDTELYERAKAAKLHIFKTEYPSYIYYRNHNDSITHNAAKLK